MDIVSVIRVSTSASSRVDNTEKKHAASVVQLGYCKEVFLARRCPINR